MSTRRGASGVSDEPAAKPSRAAGSGPVFLPPLRPRRKLFKWLAAVLIFWILFLLFLYFATVFPNRGKSGSSEVPPALTR